MIEYEIETLQRLELAATSQKVEKEKLEDVISGDQKGKKRFKEGVALHIEACDAVREHGDAGLHDALHKERKEGEIVRHALKKSEMQLRHRRGNRRRNRNAAR